MDEAAQVFLAELPKDHRSHSDHTVCCICLLIAFFKLLLLVCDTKRRLCLTLNKLQSADSLRMSHEFSNEEEETRQRREKDEVEEENKADRQREMETEHIEQKM